MTKSIDLNCDMGESYGQYITGPEASIMNFISSCNIACGFHAGDPKHIHSTIINAVKNKVRIGAHPSYPDIQGFGRRKMSIEKGELRPMLLYQIAAIDGICRAEGSQLTYVKPHGALYNSIADNEEEADTVVDSIAHFNDQLIIMGLPDSAIALKCEKKGLRFIKEGFIDRKYTANGRLSPRGSQGSVLESLEEKLRQFKDIALQKRVKTVEGKYINLEVDSVCIHGDHGGAIDLARAVTKAAAENQFSIKPI